MFNNHAVSLIDLGLVHTCTGIFENIAFSMRFASSSACKLHFRSLKTDLLENFWLVTSECAVISFCVDEVTFCAMEDVAKIVLILTLLTGLFMFTHKFTLPLPLY